MCYSPLSALGPSWKRDAASQGATLNRLKFIFVQRAGLTQHGEQRRGVVLVKAGLSHARVRALVPQVDVHDLQHSISSHVPARKSERNVWEERVVKKKQKTSQHSKSTATSIGNVLNKSGILTCFFFYCYYYLERNAVAFPINLNEIVLSFVPLAGPDKAQSRLDLNTPHKAASCRTKTQRRGDYWATDAHLEFSSAESWISSPSLLHSTSKEPCRLLSYSAWHINWAVVPLMIWASWGRLTILVGSAEFGEGGPETEAGALKRLH